MTQDIDNTQDIVGPQNTAADNRSSTDTTAGIFSLVYFLQYPRNNLSGFLLK
jgi:hypothetical protein